MKQLQAVYPERVGSGTDLNFAGDNYGHISGPGLAWAREQAILLLLVVVRRTLTQRTSCMRDDCETGSMRANILRMGKVTLQYYAT